MMLTSNRLASFPKVDLHLHLDGSIKPETVIELARDSGVELPVTDPSALSPYMSVEGSCEDLAQYLDKFHFVSPFLHSPDVLTRVAYELVEQASEHNCKYIEVRFAPQLHREQGLSMEEVIYYVLEGLKKGELAFGVKARGIAVCLRSHPDPINVEVIHAASLFIGKGLVAVDLAGAEAMYPADRFVHVFAQARKKDIPITIHAGEAAGPVNIHAAVTKLGAIRIGHGVRLKECKATFELIKNKGIPLELCPISNVQTKASPNWDAYPIREYFDQGLMVTVNTDNLTVSNTNLTKEYSVLQEKFGFTEREIQRLVMNGVEASFLPEFEKSQLRNEIEHDFARLLV